MSAKQTSSCVVGSGATQEEEEAAEAIKVEALAGAIGAAVLAPPAEVGVPTLVVIFLIPIAAKAVVAVKMNTSSKERIATCLLRIKFLAFV